MPSFDLSTILGVAVTIFTALQAAFPQNTWLPGLVAGLSAVVMNEHKAPPSNGTKS